MVRFFQHSWEKKCNYEILHIFSIYESTFAVSEFVKTCHKNINKDDNFLSPAPGERGLTTLSPVHLVLDLKFALDPVVGSS